MDLGLQGKVAIITGASEGIGKATAAALAREGAKVAICARRQDVLDQAAEAIRAASGSKDVLAVAADVSAPGQIEALFQRVIDTWGGVDIVVNNAGSAAGNRFDAVTDEAWQDDLNLKLFGAIRTSRLAIPSMRERGGGRIINVTMIGGKQPGPRSVPSAVSRAAGIALTKAMSKDLARDNILVNTVCVSTIKSGQIARGAQRQFPDLPLEDAFKKMGENMPLGRIGEAEEVADVITFLASARASFVTGDAINVDGGVSGAT